MFFIISVAAIAGIAFIFSLIALLVIGYRESHTHRPMFMGKIVVNKRDFKEYGFADMGSAFRWYNHQVNCTRVPGGPEVIVQLYDDGQLIREATL